jgi:hypothetical protein
VQRDVAKLFIVAQEIKSGWKEIGKIRDWAFVPRDSTGTCRKLGSCSYPIPRSYSGILADFDPGFRRKEMPYFR